MERYSGAPRTDGGARISSLLLSRVLFSATFWPRRHREVVFRSTSPRARGQRAHAPPSAYTLVAWKEGRKRWFPADELPCAGSAPDPTSRSSVRDRASLTDRSRYDVLRVRSYAAHVHDSCRRRSPGVHQWDGVLFFPFSFLFDLSSSISLSLALPSSGTSPRARSTARKKIRSTRFVSQIGRALDGTTRSSVSGRIAEPAKQDGTEVRSAVARTKLTRAKKGRA